MKQELIKTSVNININILNKIKTVAITKDICINEIICSLLKKAVHKDILKTKLYRSVKYQKCDHFKQWKIYRVNFQADDYEIFTDLRKLCKMSVSLLLAQAVEKFIDSMFNDKQTINNYFKVEPEITNIFSQNYNLWLYYWETRKKLRKNE